MPRRLPSFSALCALAVLALAAGSCREKPAPAPVSAPRPAAEALFPPPEPVPEGEVRLEVVLLRVPEDEVFRATAADHGGKGYWEKTASGWLHDGHATVVTRAGVCGRSGKKLEDARVVSRKFVMPYQTAQFWDLEQEALATGKPLPAARVLHESEEERETGTKLTASPSRMPEGAAAAAELDFFYSPDQPETRPVPAFPLTRGQEAPLVFFRPWRLLTHLDALLGEIVLAGAQPEPPTQDRADTDFVLLALARLTGEASPAKPNAPPTERIGQRQATIWTLGVPLATYGAWAATLDKPSSQEAAFTAWLSAAEHGEKGFQRLGVSVIAGGGSQHGGTRLTSLREWTGTIGLEPSINPLEFRSNGELDVGFSTGHSFEGGVELNRLGEKVDTEFELDFTLQRPLRATTWTKVKSAMERDEATDPGAVEIAANCGTFSKGERPLPCDVIRLLEAVTWHESVTVSFARALFQNDSAPPPPPPEPESKNGTPAAETSDPFQPGPVRVPPHPPLRDPETAHRVATTFVIDTPVSGWLAAVAGEKFDAEALGTRVLEAVKSGGARLVDVSSCAFHNGLSTSTTVQDDSPNLLEYYVNTHPHSKGIYFNPRSLTSKKLGLESRATFDTATEGPREILMEHEARFVQPPAKRHWGVWLPGIKEHGPHNSGLDLPVFPSDSLKTQLTLHAGVPVVLGVVRLARSGADEAEPRLRWFVERCQWIPWADQPDWVPTIRSRRAHRFTVLRVPETSLPGPFDEAASLDLMRRAASDSAQIAGQAVVVGCDGSPCSASTGCEWSALESRKGERHPEAVTEVIPPATEYAKQLNQITRLVGLEVAVYENGWNLRFDAAPPTIITDTLPTKYYWGRDAWWVEGNQDKPPVPISVERPIFHVLKAAGKLPEAGHSAAVRISPELVLVVREG